MALDFSIDTSGSPQDVQRKQALADALMKQGMDSTPAAGGKNGGWMTALNRGLAGALGGYQQGQAQQEQTQGRQSFNQQLAASLGADGKINPQAYLQAASNPFANPSAIGAMGKVQDWQHTAERDKVGDQHSDRSFGLQKNADARAGAAEGRAAADFENTPDQYIPNPNAAEPGQPKYIDQLAAATEAAKAKNNGGVQTLTPGGEIYRTTMVDGQPKVEVLHKNDKGVNAEDVSQETIDYLADRTRMGDPAVKIGYARNPGVIAKIDATARQREADGVPVSDAARNVTNNKVTLGARGSAERRLGTINTNNEFYGNNALGAADIAEKASAAVDRTNYKGVNAAINAWKTNTGDVKVRELGAAINTLIYDYAKFAGGGQPTEGLRNEAHAMISAADSHDQLKGILHMMRLEIKRGQQSPGMVRQGFDELYAPHGSGAPAKQPAQDQPAQSDPLGIR